MKIIILKNNLIEGLKSVDKAVGSGSNLPILKNIKIESKKNNQIILTSTNLELAIKHSVSGKVVKEGEVVVQFDILNNTVNNLNADKIYIEYKDRKINIKADNYESFINCDNPKEFPIIPTVKDKTKSIKLDSSVFKDVLRRVVVATQYSEIRPEINGVYCNLDNNQIVFAGTDSFRLAEETLNKSDFNSDFNNFNVIIPLNTVDSILKIIEEDDDLNIFTDFNQILFQDSKKSIISRLVDGDFPDYKSIIPKDTKLDVLVNREELINAVKLTKNFAGKANDIVFKFTGKILEIYSSNDIIGKNNYRVPITSKGKNKRIEVSFNWRYILDGLKMYNDKNIIIGINESEKPIIIKDKNNKGLIYIVMPIRQ